MEPLCQRTCQCGPPLISSLDEAVECLVGLLRDNRRKTTALLAAPLLRGPARNCAEDYAGAQNTHVGFDPEGVRQADQQAHQCSRESLWHAQIYVGGQKAYGEPAEERLQ
jgi:hypothetical protein